jgi:hypothetical protein
MKRRKEISRISNKGKVNTKYDVISHPGKRKKRKRRKEKM